jgi:hypothetical protein
VCSISIEQRVLAESCRNVMQLRIVCVAGSRPEIVVKTFLAEYDV